MNLPRLGGACQWASAGLGSDAPAPCGPLCGAAACSVALRLTPLSSGSLCGRAARSPARVMRSVALGDGAVAPAWALRHRPRQAAPAVAHRPPPARLASAPGSGLPGSPAPAACIGTSAHRRRRTPLATEGTGARADSSHGRFLHRAPVGSDALRLALTRSGGMRRAPVGSTLRRLFFRHPVWEIPPDPGSEIPWFQINNHKNYLFASFIQITV